MFTKCKQTLPEKIKRPLRPAWNFMRKVRHATTSLRRHCFILSATLLCKAEIRISWTFSSQPVQNPDRILIVRVDAIGDYMLFRPVLRQLCSLPAFTGKQITLCGNAAWQDLAETLDGRIFRHFIPVRRQDFAKGKYRRALFKSLREIGASVALHPTLSRDFMGDALMLASGAGERIGFDCPPQNITKICKQITNRYYTRLFTPDPGHPFELYRNYEFLRHLGWTPEPIRLERPALPADVAGACSETVRAHLGCPVFFIGAQHDWRRWPASSFAALAIEIQAFCARPAVLAAGNDCAQDALHIQNACGPLVRNLVGMTTLTESAVLAAHAPFVISNDSSGGHIAAAFAIPTVIISNGQHFGRFHPYPSQLTPRMRTLYPPDFGEDMEENLSRYYWSPSPFSIGSVSVANVVESLAQVLR